MMAAAQADQAAKASRLRVSSGWAEDHKIHDVAPTYPKEARKKQIQGIVLLITIISAKGDVVSMEPLQGDPILTEAAMKAVKQWKYNPYLLNGQPVEVQTTIKIIFHL